MLCTVNKPLSWKKKKSLLKSKNFLNPFFFLWGGGRKSTPMKNTNSFLKYGTLKITPHLKKCYFSLEIKSPFLEKKKSATLLLQNLDRLVGICTTMNFALSMKILRENVRLSVCDLKLKRTWLLQQVNRRSKAHQSHTRIWLQGKQNEAFAVAHSKAGLQSH